jgi:hypothetical protein
LNRRNFIKSTVAGLAFASIAPVQAVVTEFQCTGRCLCVEQIVHDMVVIKYPPGCPYGLKAVRTDYNEIPGCPVLDARLATWRQTPAWKLTELDQATWYAPSGQQGELACE